MKKVSDTKPLVLNYLHECNEYENGGFRFQNIHTRRNLVRTEITREKKKFYYDDSEDIPIVRQFCTYLARDFRDIVHKSVFFTLRKGVLEIIT